MLGAALAARLVSVAGVTARVARDSREPRATRTVAHVVHQRPGPVERRGPQIIGIPPDDVARRVAHAATDAFDRRVDGEAPR